MDLNGSMTPNNFRTTHCERHGDMQEAFICEHLLLGKGLGFFVDADDKQNPRPDAWCSGCESIRSHHGGWNQESEALMCVKLVCGGCYDEIKERNVLSSGQRTPVQ